MKITALSIGTLAICCALLSPAFPASNITFSVNGESTKPLAINSNGDVAGIYNYGSSYDATQAFVRTSDGTITTFNVPGANYTFVGNINDQGVIAGTYVVVGADNVSTYYGYVRSSAGVITTITPPGATDVDSAFINDNGVVAGNYNGETAGYIMAPDGSFTTFTVTGESFLNVSGININGDVGGATGSSPGVYDGLFVRTSAGAYYTIAHDFGNAYLGFAGGSAYGINASDEIVGTTIVLVNRFPGAPIYITAPFSWTNGSNVQEFAPDVAQDEPVSEAYGLNDSGDIVGTFQYQGFLQASDGTITLFNVGAEHTAAYAINSSGVITGTSGNNGFVRMP
jgi:hypothetical protein